MLDNRLNAHFATLRASAVGSALKRHAGNWPLYATVTGSALAMASSASASIIYATGPVSTSTRYQRSPPALLPRQRTPEL